VFICVDVTCVVVDAMGAKGLGMLCRIDRRCGEGVLSFVQSS
jgi:hypothetical protein